MTTILPLLHRLLPYDRSLPARLLHDSYARIPSTTTAHRCLLVTTFRPISTEYFVALAAPDRLARMRNGVRSRAGEAFTAVMWEGTWLIDDLRVVGFGLHLYSNCSGTRKRSSLKDGDDGTEDFERMDLQYFSLLCSCFVSAALLSDAASIGVGLTNQSCFTEILPVIGLTSKVSLALPKCHELINTS